MSTSFDYAKIWEVPIIFVVHSMGGLVVKKVSGFQCSYDLVLIL